MWENDRNIFKLDHTSWMFAALNTSCSFDADEFVF